MSIIDGLEDKYIFGSVTIFFGFLATFVAFKALRMKEEVEDTPTSKIRSIALGLVKLRGIVIPREIMRAPFSKKPCVYYNYKLEREFVRRQWDPMTKIWLTIREWRTIQTDEQSRRFFVEDETGKVLVDPKSAEIQNLSVYTQGRLRHTEILIPINATVSLIGTASENPDRGPSENWDENILVKKGDLQKDFVISFKSGKDFAGGYGVQFFISLIVGLALLAVGAWVILFT